MHTTIPNPTITALLSAALLLSAPACADRTRELQTSSQTPAAQAEVKIDRSSLRKTGNAQLEIEVAHLPPPTSLGDELTTFVVWLSPIGSDKAQNLGELDYDPGSREGDLDVTTPYDQFTLWVTAEPAGNPITRGEVVVASGSFDLRTGR